MLVTTLRWCWRFWPFWSPIFTIFLHKRWGPTSKFSHQHHDVTNITYENSQPEWKASGLNHVFKTVITVSSAVDSSASSKPKTYLLLNWASNISSVLSGIQFSFLRFLTWSIIWSNIGEFPPTDLPTQKFKRRFSVWLSVLFWMIFKADFTQLKRFGIPGIHPIYAFSVVYQNEPYFSYSWI